MELNVIDLSRDSSKRQERVSIKRASGEDNRPWTDRAWPEVQIERNEIAAERQRRAGSRAGQAPSGRQGRSVEPISERERSSYGEQTPVRRKRSSAEPIPVRRSASARKTAAVRRPEIIREQPVERRPRPSRAAEQRARQERIRRRKRRRRKQLAARLTVLLFMAGLIVLLLFMLVRLLTGREEKDKVVQTVQSNVKTQEVPKDTERTLKPFMTEDFLTVNEYSRPGEALEAVNNIFVHYTANRGTSAAQNRSYFENLGITGETSASAHFIIGYDGEIIQCIPLDEIGYAVMGRNYDSISIECCYLQDDGKFTEETYQSLIRLCAWLLDEYHLAPEDMKRHYDEGGKKCPLYFTEHVEAWEQFKHDLDQYLTEQKSL